MLVRTEWESKIHYKGIVAFQVGIGNQTQEKPIGLNLELSLLNFIEEWEAGDKASRAS